MAWLLAATGTFAQTPVSDFGQVPTRVRVGDTVYVTDSSGRQHKGMLFDVSASRLVLESGGKRRDFPAGQVAAISWRAPDSLGNGALAGMAVGAGLTGIALLGSCGSTDCGGWRSSPCSRPAASAPASGRASTRSSPGRIIPVYRSASGTQGASFSFSPILSPRRQGLAATVRF